MSIISESPFLAGFVEYSLDSVFEVNLKSGKVSKNLQFPIKVEASKAPSEQSRLASLEGRGRK